MQAGPGGPLLDGLKHFLDVLAPLDLVPLGPLGVVPLGHVGQLRIDGLVLCISWSLWPKLSVMNKLLNRISRGKWSFLAFLYLLRRHNKIPPKSRMERPTTTHLVAKMKPPSRL
jgi:hypothetical protein